MIQDRVRVKSILLYWLENTAINSYSENGQGRKRDRQQFETELDFLIDVGHINTKKPSHDVQSNTQSSKKRKIEPEPESVVESAGTKEKPKPKFKLGANTQFDRTKETKVQVRRKFKLGANTQFDRTKETKVQVRREQVLQNKK
jgi:hypothetical protein